MISPARSRPIGSAISRLTSNDLPAVLDPFGLHSTLEGRGGPVRCRVIAAAADEPEQSRACGGDGMLRRFTAHRKRPQRAASRMYGASHTNPLIDVEDPLISVAPDAWDDRGRDQALIQRGWAKDGSAAAGKRP